MLQVCTADSVITPENAFKWVEKQDWESEIEAEESKEEIRCLNHMRQSIISVEVDGTRYSRPISSLIAKVYGKLEKYYDEDLPDPNNDKVGREEAAATLLMYGIKVKGGILYIANSHAELEKLFKETGWRGGWKNLLLRIEGAKAKRSMRFGIGYSYARRGNTFKCNI